MARRNGKKVYNIDVHTDGHFFEVTVRLVQQNYKRVFRAELEKIDLDVTDTDSEKLEQRVRAYIKEWIKITWQLWCVVSVTGGDRGHAGDNTAVEIEVDYHAVGTHRDGKKVHCEVPRPDDFTDADYIPSGFRRNLSPGLPDHGIEESSYNDHACQYTKSLIRATPGNIAALDNFRDAMKGLVKKMHDHFHPKRIEQLLASPGLLLPAPAPKAKGKKMPRPSNKKKKVRA